MFSTGANILIFFMYNIPAAKTHRRLCAIKHKLNENLESRVSVTNLTTVYCPYHSWCCDKGCCDSSWHNWTLILVLFVIILAILRKCCKHSCRESPDTTTPSNAITLTTLNVTTRREIASTVITPPPDYSVALYYPQISDNDRIPTYEEAVSREQINNK